MAGGPSCPGAHVGQSDSAPLGYPSAMGTGMGPRAGGYKKPLGLEIPGLHSTPIKAFSLDFEPVG